MVVAEQRAGPTSTTVHRRRDPRLSTRSSSSPIRRRLNHDGSVTGMTVAPASVAFDASSATKSTEACDTTRPKRSRVGAIRTTCGPGSNVAVRNFGPPRSMATRFDDPSVSDRTWEIIAAHVGTSSWAQFTRARSIPHTAKEATSAGCEAASLGSVTMILVDRFAGGGPSSRSVLQSSKALPSATDTRALGTGAS